MMRFTLLLLVIVFVSCEEAMNVRIPIESSKLVVSSYIQADDYFNGQNSSVYVSNSISALQSAHQYEYTDSIPVINNAIVSIHEINLDYEDINSYLL